MSDWDGVDMFEEDEPVSSYEPDEPEDVSDMKSYDNVSGEELSQHVMLSYMISNISIWKNASRILTAEHFTKEYGEVFNYIRDYEGKNNVLPSVLLTAGQTQVKLEQIDTAFEETTITSVLKQIEHFYKENETTKVLLEASDDISSNRDMAHIVSNVIDRMEKIVTTTVNQDLGIDFLDDINLIMEETEKSDGNKTGYDAIDKAIGGGVTNPSYNIVSAGSGGGKSVFLQNLAINYMEMGHNIIYYTMELSEPKVGSRIAQMISATPTNTKNQRRKILEELEKYSSSNPKLGKIIIKRFNMNGTTVADLKAHHYEISQEYGGEWKHILVDYPDLLVPYSVKVTPDNIHTKDQAVSVELYDWAHDVNCNKIIWGASQQTKGANDENDARQSGVAGGTGKVNTCDNLFILKRNTSDIENGIVNVHIAKGRNGGTGEKIVLEWNPISLRVTNESELVTYDEQARPRMSISRRGNTQETKTIQEGFSSSLRRIRK